MDTTSCCTLELIQKKTTLRGIKKRLEPEQGFTGNGSKSGKDKAT